MRESYFKRYFRNKAASLQHDSDSVLAPHSGLRGSHRESLCRKFLEDFLPKRYSIGRGMIFDQIAHVSKECDVVVWDDQHYPRIVEEGHNLFLVNSVRCSIEVKSEWSSNEWSNALEKSKSVRSLVSGFGTTLSGLEDRLSYVERAIYALEQGLQHTGTLHVRHRVATAAIFLTGGTTCDPAYVEGQCPDPDDMLPDLTLFLEPGVVIERSVVSDDKGHMTGWAGFRRLGHDALMAFSFGLLELIRDRSSQLEDPVRLVDSVDLALDEQPQEGFRFRLTRPLPGSRSFFSYTNESPEDDDVGT